jgi:tripartite motif-containing protein 71
MDNRVLRFSLLGMLLLSNFCCAGRDIRLRESSFPKSKAKRSLQFIGFIGGGILERPLGLTTDLLGNIYIADGGDYRIKKFDPQGKLLQETEGYGGGRSRFSHPVDVSFGGDLRLYVLDGLNGEVQALDRDLGFLFSLGKGSGEGSLLSFPSGLASDKSGRIFVIDSRQDGLFLLASGGEFKNLYSATGFLLKPTDIAVDPQGKIYVTDGRGKLKAFDFVGGLIGSMGQEILTDPVGVATDEAGNIWVTDRSFRSILLFSPQGELMEKFLLSFPPGKLEISPPDKVLWVIDQSGARVAGYQIDQ